MDLDSAWQGGLAIKTALDVYELLPWFDVKCA